MLKIKADLLTLVAISGFFTLATAVHEHLGHSFACLLLGGNIKELGAFYVECAPASLSDMSNRLVSLAGPLISLIVGIIGISVFDRMRKSGSAPTFFLWHFATVNLMIAAGYLLFSGVAGIGDLGTGESGVFYNIQPEWIYRVALSILGLSGYYWVIRVSISRVDAFIGGEGRERVGRAQMISLFAYLSGGAVAILVGFLNPHGIVIVLISSFASSMGGTSGLAWMMQLLDRTKKTNNAPFVLERNWGWIAVSIGFLVVYAVVFGPTLYLN